jgi:hypothetical protein
MHQRALGCVVLLIGLGMCGCTSLSTTPVGAPAIRCIFDTDCKIEVSDLVDTFMVPLASGSGRLQSRSQPPGEAGTLGAGVYAHEYRVDLTPVGALTGIVCVRSLSLDFGPVHALDYDSDGSTEDVYIITSGGLGTVAPSAASQDSGRVTFTFQPGVCPGNAPGNGETSYFFGLGSDSPSGPVTATLTFDDGSSVTVAARSPAGPAGP